MMDVKAGNGRDKMGEEGKGESGRGEKGTHESRDWVKAREKYRG